MKNKTEIKLKTYQEVLSELSNEKAHLLLGNGFNNSLGVRTDYKSIFKEMEKEYAGYKDLASRLASYDYDIEKLISDLQKQIQNGENNSFLSKYIQRKIKFDFMKAAHGLVKNQVKKVYQEKNGGIHILLKNFTNYFTLNYDPLLYMLLMRFKKSAIDNDVTIALQNSFSFIEEDLNRQGDIYKKIMHAYKEGRLEITAGDNQITEELEKSTKADFKRNVFKLFQEERWNSKDISRVVDQIWKTKNLEPILDNINDGFALPFKGKTPYYHPIAQNIFFLHGAFHIYQDGKAIFKITQTQNKPLYAKLEEIIDSEGKDIICVLAGKSKDKEDSIKENSYLKSGFDKLSSLSGELVIIGCSLAFNDEHIFAQICKSNIERIFISSNEDHKHHDYKKARDIFPHKKIVLFDWESISYTKK